MTTFVNILTRCVELFIRNALYSATGVCSMHFAITQLNHVMIQGKRRKIKPFPGKVIGLLVPSFIHVQKLVQSIYLKLHALHEFYVTYNRRKHSVE